MIRRSRLTCWQAGSCDRTWSLAFLCWISLRRAAARVARRKWPCRPGRWSILPRRRPGSRGSCPSTGAEGCARARHPATSRSRNSRRRANQGRVCSGSSLQGGSSISPTSCTCLASTAGSNRLAPPRLAAAPNLVASPAKSTCTSTSSGAAARRPLAGGVVEPLQQLDRVDRLDARERCGGLLRLVRLEVADEMPPCRDIGRVGDLLQAFLHLVLAELPLPGRPRLAHAVGAERLRDGDQRDLGCRPSRAAGRLGDPLPDFGEVAGDGHGEGSRT